MPCGCLQLALCLFTACMLTCLAFESLVQRCLRLSTCVSSLHAGHNHLHYWTGGAQRQGACAAADTPHPALLGENLLRWEQAYSSCTSRVSCGWQQNLFQMSLFLLRQHSRSIYEVHAMRGAACAFLLVASPIRINTDCSGPSWPFIITMPASRCWPPLPGAA